MFANGVDLGDGRTRMDERTIGGGRSGREISSSSKLSFIVSFTVTTGFSTIDDPPPEIIKMASDVESRDAAI
jgi:hypothetical protein